MLNYELFEKRPWSEMFAKVAELNSLFKFETLLASDTTLEEIFISLSKD